MKSKKKSGHGLAVLAGIFVSCLSINAPADELADFAKPLNVEYERPGTDYARYSRLRIKDLDLSDTKIVPPPWLTEKAFKWDVPEESGDRLRQEFMDSMKEQIGGNGGYEIVTEPGEGVMELYVRIVSFMPYAERKDKVTTKGSGEMRIHAETRDAQTGELLGIYEGPQEVGKNYQPNTDFTREKNLKTLFDSWGRRIRIAMDEDHGR
jgi:hypothetical protein